MPKLVTGDGAELYYRLQGKASTSSGKTAQPPMIFVHGWCSNLEHWAPQARYFGRTRQVLRLDRRGHGRSSTPGSGHTAAQHADDIAAVAKATGLGRAIVVGHAGGGPGTLEFIRRYPKRVKAAVLIDSGMYPEPRLNDPTSPFGAVLGPMIDALQSTRGRSAFKKMYSGYFSPKCAKEVARPAVAEAARTPLSVAVDELHGMAVSTEKMADDIAVPVLWLTAAGVDQAYIASHVGNVTFGQVVGSGHFPQLEVPEQTNAMIDAFASQL